MKFRQGITEHDLRRRQAPVSGMVISHAHLSAVLICEQFVALHLSHELE